jgi:hypothetical protein
MGIMIFNNLPPYIKDTSTNVRKFEICLKWFLYTHSSHTLEEYFQYSSITSRKWLSLTLVKNFTQFKLMSFLCSSCCLYHCRSCSLSVFNLSPYLLIIHVVTQQFCPVCIIHHSCTWLI